MGQEQSSPADWMVSSIKDLTGAGSEQVKETSKAGLDASRAVMEIYNEAAGILRDRCDAAFRTGIAVMEAGFNANFEQLNRLAETKNLQDVLRQQMLWGTNLTLAVCHALKASGTRMGSGAAPDQAATA